MYIATRMLYTAQDEAIERGARRRVREPEGPTEEQRRAEIIKSKIRENDAEFLDKFMEFGAERANKKVDAMLEIVRKTIDQNCRREGIGFILSEQVANTVTRDQVVAWLTARKAKNDKSKEDREAAIRDAEWQGKSIQEVIKEAYELSRGSLAPTLKRARMLTSKKITMDDVKKWRLENANKEKKTDHKYFNSWVGNKPKEEYQVDLFFFQDLKKKQAMKELLEERAQEGNNEAEEAIADNAPVPEAFAALPEAQAVPNAKAKTKAKAKAEPKLARWSTMVLFAVEGKRSA